MVHYSKRNLVYKQIPGRGPPEGARKLRAIPNWNVKRNSALRSSLSPYVFTEQVVAMLSSVLNSKRVVHVN
jgi:hypothetical protein